MQALTPHHFLLGRPSIAFPYLPDAQKYQNHRKIFQVAQAHMANIWTRWLREYLPVHNFRQKWYKERPQLKGNDLVWIIDHREKRGFYCLGRVKKCYFGNDGNTRSCDILTQSGVVSRPTVKLSRVLDDIGCVPPKRSTGPVMQSPEKQYRKKTSNWVILQCHNFDPKIAANSLI